MGKIRRGEIQTNGTLVTVDATGNPNFQGTPSGSRELVMVVVVVMVLVVNQ